MNADEYQKLAMRTEHTPNFTHHTANPINMDRLIHAALGLATETGELQDAIKKHLMYGRSLDSPNAMEEIGDILWYCALAAKVLGYPLSEVMNRNIRKLRVRFPEAYSDEKANTRDLDAERAALEGGK